MVYTIKLSTSISSGAPSGSIYELIGINFALNIANKDKFKNLPSNTTFLTALQKMSNTATFEVMFENEADYNAMFSVFMSWKSTAMYLWVYVNGVLLNIGYSQGSVRSYMKCNLLTFNPSVANGGRVIRVKIQAIEVI